MFTDSIIMAGGSGTRLWPASNSKTPKQFLSIAGGATAGGNATAGGATKTDDAGNTATGATVAGAAGASAARSAASGAQGTFFDAALDRGFAVLDGSPQSRVIVVAGGSHVPHILKSCNALPDDQRKRVVLIAEPRARNTAPAIACAATYIRNTFGRGRTALVLTSDHLIQPLEVFVSDAAAAADLARLKKLVVFGIPPRGPETGYGYVEVGPAITPATESMGGREKPGGTGPKTFSVSSFREKPDRATAESFLSTGRFYWNSGMFAFPVDFLLEEMKRTSPETLEPFSALKAPDASAVDDSSGVSVLQAWKGLSKAYDEVRGISMDYAVAEKCSSVALVAARFGWLDVGSWDEYADIKGTQRENVFQSGSSGCFVDADLPVALCGVQDLIVVVRSGIGGAPPAVLICKKGESQTVKAVVEDIKNAGRTDLL